jgi:hypothetical protein
MDMRALAALGTAYAAELNSFCICLLPLQTNTRGISARGVFALVCRIYIVLVTAPLELLSPPAFSGLSDMIGA